MDKIQKFINALKNEIGYREKGYNWNKYAEYIDNNFPNFYNGKKQNQAWCCVFIHALGIQTFGYENALKMFGLKEHNSGAWCEGCANAYLSMGRRIKGKENIQIGDQVIFGNYSYDHTGIVYDIIDAERGIYLTIEGNYQDSVQVVKRFYSEMSFAGRPNWEAIEVV